MLSFEEELSQLLNRFSKENDSDTPDFILRDFILKSLQAFNETVNRRETWYGRDKEATDKVI